ncbi:MAG: hypothetical protein KDE23_09725, partial [Caldilinea sp.]|nr:hypothetical protein [Caldilinea sp.]
IKIAFIVAPARMNQRKPGRPAPICCADDWLAIACRSPADKTCQHIGGKFECIVASTQDPTYTICRLLRSGRDDMVDVAHAGASPSAQDKTPTAAASPPVDFHPDI